MPKGYPRFRAEIIDQSQILEIETTTLNSGDITVIMQPYTSDKGTEEWEILQGFDGFTDVKGPMSFARHGQAQITLAEILRAGGIVLGKRMVSDDATLANVTLRARVVKVGDASYLYFYTTNVENCLDFKHAVGDNNKFEADEAVQEDGTVDAPLITVAPMGRGASNIWFRINPEYNNSRSRNNYIQFTFEIYDGTKLLESHSVSMNPNIIINNVSQAMNPKVRSNTQQIQIQLYDDGVEAICTALAETAVMNDEALTVAQLINLDFINGYDLKGTTRIGGVVTVVDADEDGSDDWSTYMPSDIKDYVVDISGLDGVTLEGGSYGSMGAKPIKNSEEYEKILLGTFGANTNNTNYRPELYDLDMFKVDAIFDADWPFTVKNQVLNVVDFRGDMMYFADLGKTADNDTDIVDLASNIPYSRNVAIYHNYFNVYDPYTRREITVTLPYLLAIKMVQHLNNSVAAPFAGQANSLTFENDIIPGTINYIPRIIPGRDSKQILTDANVNYISFYNTTPVLDTEFTNNEEYSQLSYLNNVMNVQQIIKRLRTEHPRKRYTFVDGDDLAKYIEDTQEIIDEYKSDYADIYVTYMYDPAYEQNKIFYATLTVRFKEFFDEEYFKIFAIN